jgi:hypothetical protein
MRNDLYTHTRDPSIEHNFHHHCTRDLHETRELKRGKNRLQPRGLPRHVIDVILETTSQGDMIMKKYGVCQNIPPFYPVQTKRMTSHSVEQMQLTMKEKQKSCGRGNVQWRFATKTRQDQDRSALRRPTSSGSGQHHRHPRRGYCYRSSRFQCPVVAG